MPTKDEIGARFSDQLVTARKEFDDVDKEVNASVQKILGAFAKLAQEKPEELFGLRPSERDEFYANRLLNPEVVRAASSGSSPESGASIDEDFTGSNPAGIVEAVVGIAGSEGGPKIVESLLNHIRSEKSFAKETAGQVFNYVFGGGG